MTALDPGLDAFAPIGGGRLVGVHPATVHDIRDPEQQGRVQVDLPWSPDHGSGEYRVWARLATLMGGASRGSWFVPDVGDEVLVAFVGGDPTHPYVVGALWNGKDEPPQTMDGSGRNDLKVLRSRRGVTITLDDANGRERLVLETPGGQKVELEDGPAKLKVSDANGNSATLDSSGITVVAAAKVVVQAASCEITAGTVQVNAGMSTFSGVVKADTVITNSVVSASYTPGAGNIW